MIRSKKFRPFVVALCLVCLVVGICGVYGVWKLARYYSKFRADTQDLLEVMALGESGQRAFAAYHHESKEAAISTMQEFLTMLEKALTIHPHTTAYSFDITLTHARLAKLYGETGQSELRAQHLAAAFDYARRMPESYQQLTNETALYALVSRLDENIK